MQISKTFTFDASHWLPRHEGKCGRLHGHTYTITVTIEGVVQKGSQFVMDYGDLKEIVKPIIERFDHRHLNNFIIYPSAENIATHIAHLLWPKLQEKFNFRIRVQETPNTDAVWDSMLHEDFARFDDPEGEWKSPSLHHDAMVFEKGTTPQEAVKTAITRHHEKASQLFQAFETEKTKAEQLQLYADSTTPVNLTLFPFEKV
jgi:6-pyruvoyltetrahydropterin/6-carboxytetrahydropterin synthase